MTMTQRQEAVAAIEMLEDEDVRSVIDYVEFLAQRHQRNAEKTAEKKWELFELGRKSFSDDFMEHGREQGSEQLRETFD